MALMRLIMAAVVAFCVAIFPIAMPRVMGHAHASTPSAQHIHADHIHADADHVHTAAVEHRHADTHVCEAAGPRSNECSSPDSALPSSGEQSCCGVACHLFNLSTAAAVCIPTSAPVSVGVPGDEQVSETLSSRLDRPPRTF